MAQENNPRVPLAVLLLTLLAGGLNSVFAAGNGDVAALTGGVIDSALGFLPADKAETHKQQSEIDALRAALNATVAKEGPPGPPGPPGINGTNAPACPTVIGSSQINQCCAGNDQCLGVAPFVQPCRRRLQANQQCDGHSDLPRYLWGVPPGGRARMHHG
ncbi:g6591 [Coccomyxa elongata]